MKLGKPCYSKRWHADIDTHIWSEIKVFYVRFGAAATAAYEF